jgi:hypothetical protein
LPFQHEVGFPECCIRDLVYLLPQLWIVMVCDPVRVHVGAIDLVDLRSHPGRDMDTVGDRLDGDLFLGHVWPERAPHATRHLAVPLAHTVAVAGEA